jgi:hypothetical protein
MIPVSFDGFSVCDRSSHHSGSYEGRATTWMTDRVLTHPASRLDSIDLRICDALKRNVDKTGRGSQVTLHEGLSRDVLRGLPPDAYDFIYVDGSRTAVESVPSAETRPRRVPRHVRASGSLPTPGRSVGRRLAALGQEGAREPLLNRQAPRLRRESATHDVFSAIQMPGLTSRMWMRFWCRRGAACVTRISPSPV